MLRERKYKTLADMKTDAIEVEANRATSSKLRAKAEKVERKLKARKETGTCSKIKEEEHKIDEINTMLRNLSNKISRMEMQPLKVKKM